MLWLAAWLNSQRASVAEGRSHDACAMSARRHLAIAVSVLAPCVFRVLRFAWIVQDEWSPRRKSTAPQPKSITAPMLLTHPRLQKNLVLGQKTVMMFPLLTRVVMNPSTTRVFLDSTLSPMPTRSFRLSTFYPILLAPVYLNCPRHRTLRASVGCNF